MIPKTTSLKIFLLLKLLSFSPYIEKEKNFSLNFPKKDHLESLSAIPEFQNKINLSIIKQKIVERIYFFTFLIIKTKVGKNNIQRMQNSYGQKNVHMSKHHP